MRNNAFVRSRYLGFDAWLGVLAITIAVPGASRLWAAMAVLAVVFLLAPRVTRLASGDLTALHTGVLAMMAASVVLPSMGYTAWWSMVLPTGVLIWALGSRRGRDPFVWVLAWTMCIGLVSGGAGGSDGWTGWLERLLGITTAQAELLMVTIRKGIHFVYYGVLAVLVAHFVEERLHPTPIRTAVWIAMGIATYDEMRQLFTPFRTGSVRDWLIDLFGVVVCLTIWKWQLMRRRSEDRVGVAANLETRRHR